MASVAKWDNVSDLSVAGLIIQNHSCFEGSLTAMQSKLRALWQAQLKSQSSNRSTTKDQSSKLDETRRVGLVLSEMAEKRNRNGAFPGGRQLLGAFNSSSNRGNC